MYNQVPGSYPKSEVNGNNHTTQVKAAEIRFEGGNTSISSVSQKPAIILTPELRVQNETIWRSNAVAQPVQVVFTYSNRANEIQPTFVPSQQIQIQAQQTIAQRHSPIITNNVRPATNHNTTNLTELRTASIQTTTTVKDITFQQRFINEHMVVRREEQRQLKQQHPMHMQNFNNFGGARTAEITQQPLIYKYNTNQLNRTEQPLSIPPIDTFQKEYVSSSKRHETLNQHTVYHSPRGIHSPPHNIEMFNQRIQSSTIPSSYGSNKVESPTKGVTDTSEKSKVDETSSNLTKKKPAIDKPKKAGKGNDRQNTSRSEKSNASKKNKQLSMTRTPLTREKIHKGVTSAKKLSTNLSSHQSDRLLEHRPCGRRHCTACQLKKKESGSSTKLKTEK